MKLTVYLFFFFISFSAYSQELNQTITDGFKLIDYSKEKMEIFLKTGNYILFNKQSNFYKYGKVNDYGGHMLTFAYHNNKVSAVSWDEYIRNSGKIISELQNLDFIMKINQIIGDKQVRSYENIKRNLLVTLTSKEEFFTIILGVKDPSKPYMTNVSRSNIITNVDYQLSPRDNNSRVLSKPNIAQIHPDFKDGEIGLSWGFRATSKIETPSGIFYGGYIVSSRGTAQVNKPYYILASEWILYK